MKNHIVTLGIFVLMAGCSSTPKEDTISTYKSNYETKAYADLKAKSCPSNNKFMEEKDLKVLMSYANSCVKAKKWSKLKSIANQVLQKHSHTPWGAYYMSLYAENNKEYERSLWMVDLAIKKAPKVPLLHYQKARLEWKLNHNYEAIEGMKRALVFDDKLIEAHLFLANIYLRDQFYKEALTHYKKIISVKGDQYDALAGLSEVFLAQNDHKNAETYLKKALDEQPKNLLLKVKLAVLYDRNLMLHEEALSVYKKIQRSHSKSELDAVSSINVASRVLELEKLIAIKKERERNISSTQLKDKKGEPQ